MRSNNRDFKETGKPPGNVPQPVSDAKTKRDTPHPGKALGMPRQGVRERCRSRLDGKKGDNNRGANQAEDKGDERSKGDGCRGL